MSTFINPGSGPVEERHSPEGAARNMDQLAADLAERTGQSSTVEPMMHGHGGGRYLFTLKTGEIEHEVEMPGIALEAVRYLGREHGQDPWDFPRLYVDGSSWLWAFALDVLEGEVAKG